MNCNEGWPIGSAFTLWIHNSWIVFLTIPELWFSQFKNCENHNVIILILIILIIVILILFYPFRNGIERKWPFMYNHRNQAVIAYSCECILKITASFAIIIHSNFITHLQRSEKSCSLLDGKTIRSRRNEWRVRLSISWISFYQKATTEKFSWERVRLYLIISLIRQWPVITG